MLHVRGKNSTPLLSQPSQGHKSTKNHSQSQLSWDDLTEVRPVTPPPSHLPEWMVKSLWRKLYHPEYHFFFLQDDICYRKMKRNLIIERSRNLGGWAGQRQFANYQENLQRSAINEKNVIVVFYNTNMWDIWDYNYLQSKSLCKRQAFFLVSHMGSPRNKPSFLISAWVTGN